ncbi:hypothetical protein GDO81_004199 [Engystomops pustulosus]|uniref:Uncharacterized protein n=1 Tax=Engystomops pustulosus TaxID=76066 RepID=A0AAV6ZQN3_ENGPU|nr:hypothetical protein GDO81_004199 [Engystomops pustulosus]
MSLPAPDSLYTAGISAISSSFPMHSGPPIHRDIDVLCCDPTFSSNSCYRVVPPYILDSSTIYPKIASKLGEISLIQHYVILIWILLIPAADITLYLQYLHVQRKQ